ncbi:hypothetical protein Sulac_1414 [Sulfobacillus acidophilus DSM 10332]|uniref:Uncharacterized protein n=1 Tax=Sulfobacillus acidophilus (strain ATCC 700253 / DSM 10332 / NAL) TaxID=679936 RepID=G8TX03_SULAD|nr:hypothetical protein Sulac_1414 [Sulfobacillus acidophilus DSM 10332]
MNRWHDSEERITEDELAAVMAAILLLERPGALEGEHPVALKVREIWPKPSPWRWSYTVG